MGAIVEKTTPRGAIADGSAINKSQTSWAEGGRAGLGHQTQAGHMPQVLRTTWGARDVSELGGREVEKKKSQRSSVAARSGDSARSVDSTAPKSVIDSEEQR